MSYRGEDIIPIALQHVGERYVLGARVPLLSEEWRGPWDCAEFVSWCVYRAYQLVFGAQPADPRSGDPYTGFWWDQTAAQGLQTSVAEALATPGAIVLRRPRPGLVGHIAICTGDGKLIEAAGRKLGVVHRKNTLDRRWDVGCHVPGVLYTVGQVKAAPAPAAVLRVASPYMRGEKVLAVQKVLAALGYSVGPLDAIYADLTEAAVAAFQADKGLIVDGEVGTATLRALKLK